MDSFLKKYCTKHNIVLQRGHNLCILLTLVWNRVLILKLKIYKWIHGINKPIIHYYAVCWNEEKMLPFVFDYYGKFVDKFVIYDNGSTDRTMEIVNSQPNAELIHFETEGFDDAIHAKIKNSCWKHSRGKADFVIVCDVDEFLYHEKLEEKLIELHKAHISLPDTEGFNMYCSEFPLEGLPITQQVKTGIADGAYNKSILFDPYRIVEINYTPGAHHANPIGIVKRSHESLKVLHYKNLGLENVIERYHVLANRLSENNISEDLGTHYMYSDTKIASDFNENIEHCKIVI